MTATRANPITRARTREDPPLRKLRKGRERCGAKRRDGQPCQAPAIKGGTVCRRHGGSAPQVRFAARHRVLAEAAFAAWLGYEAARETADAFGALCKWSTADRDLKEYEAKMEYLVELKAELRRRKAERT